jgi:phospholipid/cholesterol/gamma-HCH transport system ATP-binding protein
MREKQMQEPAKIQLVDLKKKFDVAWVTNGVNLSIPAHKMTVVVGRSGEGKSVLLKQIIGLIEPTSGAVIIDGIDMTQLSSQELAKQFSKFGYVFQFAALLDSLNVLQNIGITLLENGMSEEEVVPVVKEKLALVKLDEANLYKYPAELSGGMRKRVGLARTLISNPEIILYDEPTTGLDPITTRAIHELMFSMQHQLKKITSVVISHDVESFNYADYVALLHDGTIKYFGEAKTVWDSDNPYIYQFIRGLPEGPIQTEIPHAKNKF